MKKTILLALGILLAGGISAQEIMTANMLEIAPQRHIINPAFEPQTEGYFIAPVLSHTGALIGNTSIGMNDLIVNRNGTTMWTLNPEANYDLLGAFHKNTLVRADVNTAIFGFGFRLPKGGYLHVNADLTADAGANLPRTIFEFALDGGMKDLSGGSNITDITQLGARAQAYLSLGAGYSKQKGDWGWGFQVKLLDGIAYAGVRSKSLQMDTKADEWTLRGNGYMEIAAPFNPNLEEVLPSGPGYYDMERWSKQEKLFDWKNVGNLLTPCGYGAAVDLGVTYKPASFVKLSAAITDLGAIYWNRGRKLGYEADGTYNGVGTIVYGDYTDEEGNFNGRQLWDTIETHLEDIYKTAFRSSDEYTCEEGNWQNGFLAPLTMKINAGADFYLCRDIIGLGIYSRTLLHDSRLYEELTIGAAVRPCKWFNFALSYSMMNGKWDNLGVAIGLRGGPVVLTLAADYVPMTWTHYTTESEKRIALPYKAKGVNAELGIAFVWGWKESKITTETITY